MRRIVKSYSPESASWPSAHNLAYILLNAIELFYFETDRTFSLIVINDEIKL
jgi:hypothetical protein